MPNNRRRTARQSQPETPVQNDPHEQGLRPAEEAGQVQAAAENQSTGEGHTEEQQAATPAGEARGEGQEEQTTAEGQNAGEAAAEIQGAGEDHTAEEQAAAETPAPAEEAQGGLPMTVKLHTGARVEDVVATADVSLGDVCTIRNVKIKEDDYGLKVVMPRTKMPDTGRFKDACYFHTPELREQFDAAVKEAYQQTLQQDQEQGGMGGMTM